MPVSTLGTGMGIPSASIYITELMRKFGAQRLVRVGSCGAVSSDLAMRDVILATGACTDSGVNRRRYRGYDFAAVADFGLLRAAADVAAANGIPVHTGLVHSSDMFYAPDDGLEESMERMGVLAIEMEAAGLYGAAAEEGRRALAILTVSDVPGQKATAEEREQSFDEMITIALEALVADAG
jgi:purine-nucleoside phosphorylase